MHNILKGQQLVRQENRTNVTAVAVPLEGGAIAHLCDVIQHSGNVLLLAVPGRVLFC